MSKIVKLIILLVALLFVSAGCGESEVTGTSTPTTMPSPTVTPIPSPTVTPPMRGPYLGQQPPGLEPVVFAPGIISSTVFSEYSGSFSPDGDEYFFYRFSEDTQSRLYTTRLQDGFWIEPEELAFSAGHAAYEPLITLDNQRLYYSWDNPALSGETSGLPVYFFVARTGDGWSEPVYAGQGMFLSMSRDGYLYTTDMSSWRSGRTYLARVTTVDGVFSGYERLEINVPWGEPAHPCIALDESYILFDVDSGSYLFASFKNTDGTWGEPIDLTDHGFDPLAGGAYISPDGQYLFFALGGDIWWVDIQVIETLRPGGQ